MAAAQKWVSFVRRGYVTYEHAGAVRPLEIEWEASHEDAISQTIAQLDELGDLIDGDLRDGEVPQLLRAVDQGSYRQ
jgi:hypothetical protein